LDFLRTGEEISELKGRAAETGEERKCKKTPIEKLENGVKRVLGIR